MKAPRKPHDVWGAVSPALFAGRFVFGGIKSISNPAAFRIQGQGFVDPFPRNDHTKLPVFRDDRYPVTGQIDCGALSWCCGRPTAPSTLRLQRKGEEHKKHKRHKK